MMNEFALWIIGIFVIVVIIVAYGIWQQIKFDNKFEDDYEEHDPYVDDYGRKL